MRKAELKELYRKLTIFLGKKIQILNLEGWQDREIYEETGVSSNRLTEAKKFDKYQRPINDKVLIAFIEKDLLKVEEILKKVDLTKAEAEYVQGLKYYENHELRRLIAKMYEKDIDVLNLLLEEFNKIKNK